jgi:hypothetical protein
MVIFHRFLYVYQRVMVWTLRRVLKSKVGPPKIQGFKVSYFSTFKGDRKNTASWNVGVHLPAPKKGKKVRVAWKTLKVLDGTRWFSFISCLTLSKTWPATYWWAHWHLVFLNSYRGASLGILSHPGILPRDFDGSRIMKNGALPIKL